MTTTTSDITAAEWLDVRDHVASRVAQAVSPQTKVETRINVAERLLRDGLIDIAAVLDKIRPKPKPVITDVADFALTSTDRTNIQKTLKYNQVITEAVK